MREIGTLRNFHPLCPLCALRAPSTPNDDARLMTQHQDPNDRATPGEGRLRSPLRSLVRWFDSWSQVVHEGEEGIDWLRAVPFLALHVACIAVIWVGWSPVALLVCGGLYAARMFAIT